MDQIRKTNMKFPPRCKPGEIPPSFWIMYFDRLIVIPTQMARKGLKNWIFKIKNEKTKELEISDEE